MGQGESITKQQLRKLRDEAYFYIDGITIGLLLLGFGLALLAFHVPRTSDEVLSWLPGTLVFLGSLSLVRKLVRPFKNGDEGSIGTAPDEAQDILKPVTSKQLQGSQTASGATSRVLPLAGKALLKMIWGMTLNLSHEPQQVDLGKEFDKQFQAILGDIEKLERNKDMNRAFVQNFRLLTAGTLRDIAFIRENHVMYLDYTADKLTRRRKNLELVADPGSFSGPGLYSKIGSFVGAGSVGPFLVHATDLQATFLAFGAIGFAGAVGITLIVRAYSYLTDDSWTKKLMTNLGAYWRNYFKVDMTNQLFYARRHIKRLIHQCYDIDTAKEIFDQDRFLDMNEADPEKKKEIIDIIKEEVLPPDRLKWSPYFVTTVVKPTSDGGTKVTPLHGNGSSEGNGDKAPVKPKNAPQDGATKTQSFHYVQLPTASVE